MNTDHGIMRRGTRPLKDGDFLFKGDTLTAQKYSSGSLYFISEKTKITLKPESQFSIESNIDKTETERVFDVQKGRVYFDVAHQQDGFNFTIKSAKANASIIGTKLEVFSELHASTIKVFEGLVRVKSKLSGDIVDVPSDHYVSISNEDFPNVRSISGTKPQIIGFSLFDAQSDKLVQGFENLRDGIILDKKQIPQGISIRINASNSHLIDGIRVSLKDSKGVRIEFKASNYEKFPPYTMTGDHIAGDYEIWDAPPGEYILNTQIFDLSKDKAHATSLTFTIR